MMVVGLDVNSVRTGYAYGDSRTGSLPVTGSWRGPGGEDLAKACGQLGQHVENLCRRVTAEIVAIEEPVKPKDRSAHTDLVLTSLFGAAISAAAKCGAVVHAVAPSTWRAHFLGTHFPKKWDAKKKSLRMVQLLRIPAANHDEADAAGIWDWACHRRANTLFSGEEQRVFGKGGAA